MFYSSTTIYVTHTHTSNKQWAPFNFKAKPFNQLLFMLYVYFHAHHLHDESCTILYFVRFFSSSSCFEIWFFFSPTRTNLSWIKPNKLWIVCVCVRCCVCVRSLWSPSSSCATVRSQPLLFTLIETQTFKIEHKWRFNQRKIVCDHELLLVFFLLKQSIWWWLDCLSFLCYSVAFIHPHKHFSNTLNSLFRIAFYRLSFAFYMITSHFSIRS